MPNQWFRMYHEFAVDPKVQMLSEADQRRYIMLLCLRCCNGDVTLHETEIVFQLRISNDEWLKTKAILVAKNLITDDCKPVAWDKRQYVSDSSAARVAKHRANKKNTCNNHVTLQKRPQNTDTDTDKELNTVDSLTSVVNLTSVGSKNIFVADAKKNQQKKTNFIPPTLTEVSEYCTERGNQIDAQKFVSSYEQKGWMVGKHKMKDWKAAVRNWEVNGWGSSEKSTGPPQNKNNTRRITQEQLLSLDF